MEREFSIILVVLPELAVRQLHGSLLPALILLQRSRNGCCGLNTESPNSHSLECTDHDQTANLYYAILFLIGNYGNLDFLCGQETYPMSEVLSGK